MAAFVFAAGVCIQFPGASVSPQSEKQVWLDLARGLSALAVCAGHLRGALFADYGSLQHPGVFTQIFYFATGLGHQAVIVFFVLSGYFVGGSVLQRGAGFRFSSYALTRLTRLWVVLIPALFLTWAAGMLASRWVPELLAGAYAASWNSGPQPGQYADDALTLLGNLLFLQTITVQTYGLNGPLWSLANEFWYYVLFPLVAVALGAAGHSRAVGRIACAVVAAGLLCWLPADCVELMGVWLLGVAAHWLVRRTVQRRRPLGLIASGAAFATALLYAKSGSLQQWLGWPSDWVVALGFTPFCIVLARWPRPGTPFGCAIGRVGGGLSEISYSLYLAHFPVVALLGGLWLRGNVLVPGPITFAAWSVCLLSLLFVATSFWWLSERHTVTLRQWLANKLRLD